jgi:hypothetical protein
VTDWSPNMKQRATPEGRQVKCLIADEGHVWIHYYDQLPTAVRQRLATSVHNICPACLAIQVEETARCSKTKPTVTSYFRAIAEIERKLR